MSEGKSDNKNDFIFLVAELSDISGLLEIYKQKGYKITFFGPYSWEIIEKEERKYQAVDQFYATLEKAKVEKPTRVHINDSLNMKASDDIKTGDLIVELLGHDIWEVAKVDIANYEQDFLSHTITTGLYKTNSKEDAIKWIKRNYTDIEFIG